MSLNDDLKQRIQATYSHWLTTNEYKPRRSQREMIAAVARLIGNISYDSDNHRTASDAPHLGLIEAGTGTGKTVAYLLPSIILAQALNKKLVVSTATINLQEQLIHKDLPSLEETAGLDFTYALAKGRGRYLCLSKLNLRLEDADNAAGGAVLFPDEESYLAPGVISWLRELQRDYAAEVWDGDRDNYNATYDDADFSLVAADGVSCTGRKCEYFSRCALFKARENVMTADVIVANHDLLLADRASENESSVFPPVQETIYIIDEAHHLPEKSRNRHSLTLSLRQEAFNLSRTESLLKQIKAVDELPEDVVGKVERQLKSVDEGLKPSLQSLSAHALALTESAVADYGPLVYRFSGGRVDQGTAQLMADLQGCFALRASALSTLSKLLHDYRERLSSQHQNVLDAVLVSLGPQAEAATSASEFCEDYAQSEAVEGVALAATAARWIGVEDSGAASFYSVPLSVSARLRAQIWDNCFAAVLTSATLASLNKLEQFAENCGCKEQETSMLLLPGELNYQAAVFHVPDMKSDPGNAAAHTEEIIQLIPQLLHPQHGSLVLFSSRKQMDEVKQALSGKLGSELLVQGDYSKNELLRRHKQRIEQHERSVIFGLASFSEGVDLPGKYCEEVIIAKLPFAVPDNPVEEAMAEWIEASGGDAFYQMTLPNTSLRLMQACGRLLRSEKDSGRISLLDTRILSRRYGRTLLNALPPFSRVMG